VADLQAGDKVKVTGGGYNGSEGVVEVVEGELAKIKISSFGVPLSCRVELTQLEKVDGEAG
jgi:transcription antitermination factor NusG